MWNFFESADVLFGESALSAPLLINKPNFMSLSFRRSSILSVNDDALIKIHRMNTRIPIFDVSEGSIEINCNKLEGVYLK